MRDRYSLEEMYYQHLLTKGHTEEEADFIALRWAVKHPMWLTTDFEVAAYEEQKKASEEEDWL